MSKLDKALLIELFEFPRKRVVQSMELRHCPHAGFFNPTDEQCIYCHQGMECVWMNHNDELVALEEKSEEELDMKMRAQKNAGLSILRSKSLMRRLPNMGHTKN